MLLAAHEAWIAIQRDGLGSALPAQGLDHCLACRFGGEILAHVGVDQQRSAHVDGIEDLDHMVLYPPPVCPQFFLYEAIGAEVASSHRLGCELDASFPAF